MIHSDMISRSEIFSENDLCRSLAHVFWLGGPSDSGKTSVMNLLVQRRRWQRYPCDFHEHNHLIARADPVLHPSIYQSLDRSLDENWLHPTPQQLFEQILATNDERFPMICDDLRLMPRKPPVLAEGPRLFPKLVVTVLTSLNQAVWLIPTADFARASQERRDKPTGRFESSDPERLRENFLARERLLAEYIEREITRLGLPFIEVDGQRTVKDIADEVEARFATYPAYV
jgi:hypothetical protein